MKPIDWFIIGAILFCVAAVIVYLKKRKGSGCAGCKGCANCKGGDSCQGGDNCQSCFGGTSPKDEANRTDGRNL